MFSTHSSVQKHKIVDFFLSMKKINPLSKTAESTEVFVLSPNQFLDG